MDDYILLVRVLSAFITSLVLFILLGKYYINFLSGLKILQPLREKAINHEGKLKTPTMGGVLIIFIFLISTALFVHMYIEIITIILIAVSFAIMGLIDDIYKVKYQNGKGLGVKLRLVIGAVISVALIIIMQQVHDSNLATSIMIPVAGGIIIPISWAFYCWGALVLVGTTNAVNLTDGLDTLLSWLSIAVIIALAVIISLLIESNVAYTTVANNIHMSELYIMIAALVGSISGFLWYNSYPAKIFMGDVGSLFIGSMIGAIALMCKLELMLPLIGVIFVLEAVSVILQVISFKTTGKRIFLVAPLHHHFEKKGLHESTVVIRFLLFNIILIAITIIGIILL